LARCQCGDSTGCQCVVQAGTGTTVTGSGSPANPYIVSADAPDCSAVRACLSAGSGVTYNSTTGVIQACVSGDAGNNLVLGSDNCLYVPAQGATVATGCGLEGDGSAGSPLAVNTATWPFACDIDTQARGVYCRGDGQLVADPAYHGDVVSQFTGQTYADLAVPAPAATTIFSTSVTLNNPDPCRQMRFFALLSADVDFRIPANGSAAPRINNDRQFLYRHTGGGDIGNISIQTNITSVGVIAAGGSVIIPLDVQLGEGSGGATYDAISTGIRAIAYAAV